MRFSARTHNLRNERSPCTIQIKPKNHKFCLLYLPPHSMNLNANVCLREFNQELAERPMEHLHFIEMTIVLCKYVKKKLQVWWPHTYLHTDIEYSNETWDTITHNLTTENIIKCVSFLIPRIKIPIETTHKSSHLIFNMGKLVSRNLAWIS